MSFKIQRSFAAGELSPAYHSRADTSRYAEGVKTALNAVVLRTGGLQSRAGFQYLGTTKSSGAARLEAVVFDTDANYILEFGNLYVRFWKDGAAITATVTGAWADATAYTAGVVVSYSGTNYVCLVAHTSVLATDRPSTGSSWETKWYALTGTTYELPTPYTTAQLFVVQMGYEYNVITLTHSSHPPATLTRISNNVWDYAETVLTETVTTPGNVAVSGTGGTGWGYTVTAIVDGVESTAGAYVRTNVVSGGVPFAIYTALATTPRTVTWNAVSGATAYRVYANELNAFTATELRGEGTATTFVDNGGFATSYTDPPTVGWTLAGAGTYPAVVAAYQQRLILAASTNEPDVAQASKVAAPRVFDVSDPIVDSDALSWRQVGRRLNRIRHFAEVAQVLMQFSDAGESIIQGDTDGILRPGEVNPRQFSENGTAINPSPLVVNDSALYVQARGSLIRDVAPMPVSGFAGSDLTLMSAHLTDGYTVSDWCYQQTPNSTVWIVRSDGALLSLTYVRELGVLGWAKHTTDGTFESVACVVEGTRDVVYAVVNRTINSSTVRYMERMTDRLADTEDLVLMDAAVTVSA